MRWVVEVSRFSVRIVCVTVPKQNVQKSFSVSLIQVSNTFCIRGIGHDFLSIFLVSQCRKRIVDESFSVSLIFGYRKSLCIRGVYHDILSRIFRLTVTQKLYMNLMCFTDFGYR